MKDDDFLTFIDETPASETPGQALHDDASSGGRADPWRVLAVDDDQDVHETTAYALRGLEIAGRSLQLLHAYSGSEAVALLRSEPEVAVILLDVVMETDDAGLVTVETIRGELGMYNTRIILRTGQPGQAPEIETIRRYDINDYKTKSELTRPKLYTSLTTAIRSYDQLRRLDASRRGLEQIVSASNQFIAETGLQSFAEGVITQIASLIGIDPAGLLCACVDQPHPGDAPDQTQYLVIAAAGRFRHLIQQRITELVLEAAGHYGAPYFRGFGEGDNEHPIGPEFAHRAAPIYFNTRKTTIYGGSNEIQRNIISKMILGL